MAKGNYGVTWYATQAHTHTRSARPLMPLYPNTFRGDSLRLESRRLNILAAGVKPVAYVRGGQSPLDPPPPPRFVLPFSLSLSLCRLLRFSCAPRSGTVVFSLKNIIENESTSAGYCRSRARY